MAEHRDTETRQPAQPDLLVVGAGSAGFSAAITAAELGANVTMVGAGTIGGTCVNVGCIPSKNLIRATELVRHGNDANRFPGLRGAIEIASWDALQQQKQSLVDGLRQAKYEDLLGDYPNITYVRGQARFSHDGREINVDGVPYRAGKIVIATGARAVLPPIDGIERVSALDSTRALAIPELPGSLIVIGGGVIGCELGQMFARAGVQVSLCCRSRLLPGVEPEISAALAAQLRYEGIEVCDGADYRSIEARASGAELICSIGDQQRIIEGERVLVATGRRPNTESLGLGLAGIRTSAGGGIETNAFMQTSNPDVYAAGDATGRDMYVYMAAYGAKLAAQNALNGNHLRYDSSVMPVVVFTDPQVASVGLTESAAKAQGYDVKTSTLTLDSVPRFLAARRTTGLIKLVADSATDALLGATLFAPEAGDSLQTAVMALQAGLTTQALADTIFPYLTAVEGLKLAAQGFHKDVSKLSCCAG